MSDKPAVLARQHYRTLDNAADILRFLTTSLNHASANTLADLKFSPYDLAGLCVLLEGISEKIESVLEEVAIMDESYSEEEV